MLMKNRNTVTKYPHKSIVHVWIANECSRIHVWIVNIINECSFIHVQHYDFLWLFFHLCALLHDLQLLHSY